MDYEQYIKVPLAVITDKNLKPSTKVLFSILIILVQQEGYCFAGNDYLAEKLNKSNRTISRLLKELSDIGYIKMEFKHKFQRKIYIIK